MRDFEGFLGFINSMDATKAFEVTIVERLHPHRYPRDAAVGKSTETASLDGTGICFEGDLWVIRHRPMFANAFDDRSDGVGMHQAGCAATKEDSVNHATRQFGSGAVEFGKICVEPATLVYFT